MKIVVFVISILIIFPIVSAIICFLIDYAEHVKESKKQGCPYDYVHFSVFLREFQRYKDNDNLRIDETFETIRLGSNNYQHDKIYLTLYIVQFGDKCMIFYPVDYLRYWFWKKKYFRDKYSREKGLFEGTQA